MTYHNLRGGHRKVGRPFYADSGNVIVRTYPKNQG